MARRYQTIPVRKAEVGIHSGSLIYYPVTFPEPPISNEDIYIIAGEGDRLDNIAFDFYGDPTLWWVIASANPGMTAGDSIYIPGPECGKQLRIPANSSDAIAQYQQENT